MHDRRTVVIDVRRELILGQIWKLRHSGWKELSFRSRSPKLQWYEMGVGVNNRWSRGCECRTKLQNVQSWLSRTSRCQSFICYIKSRTAVELRKQPYAVEESRGVVQREKKGGVK